MTCLNFWYSRHHYQYYIDLQECKVMIMILDKYLTSPRIVKLQTNVCIRMSTNFHLVHSNKISLLSNTHNIQLNELSQCGVWKVWMRRFGEKEKWEIWVELAGCPTLTHSRLFQSCFYTNVILSFVQWNNMWLIIKLKKMMRMTMIL